jgi:hypothetical protein
MDESGAACRFNRTIRPYHRNHVLLQLKGDEGGPKRATICQLVDNLNMLYYYNKDELVPIATGNWD